MTTYNPSLKAFKINGVTPFWSAADAADQQMAQAHAILTLLSGAHDVCESASHEVADPFMTICPRITASALDGIATLIALAQHQTDEAHSSSLTSRKDQREWEAEHKSNDPTWTDLVSAFEAAKAQMDEHGRDRDEAPFNSPESLAHEAKTAALCDTFDTAASRLLLTDAPDQKALLFKLQILALPTFTTMACNEAGEYAKQVAHDAERLLAGEA